MLTHNNLSSNEETSAEPYRMTPADTAVSFLPLSHVYERVTAYAYLFHGVPVAYVERMDDLAAGAAGNSSDACRRGAARF